jgi:hypothetical protein
MQEEKDAFVQEKCKWESPFVIVLSVEDETLGEGSYLSDSFEGAS